MRTRSKDEAHPRVLVSTLFSPAPFLGVSEYLSHLLLESAAGLRHMASRGGLWALACWSIFLSHQQHLAISNQWAYGEGET